MPSRGRAILTHLAPLISPRKGIGVFVPLRPFVALDPLQLGARARSSQFVQLLDEIEILDLLPLLASSPAVPLPCCGPCGNRVNAQLAIAEHWRLPSGAEH